MAAADALILWACTAAAVPAVLDAQCPDGSPPPCARPASRAAIPATSVAVLYFDNLSRDTNDAYVADGLTEELIARLGQIERLQVKSRTAVQRYRGRPIDDPASLGRALGVAHLVSGSVRRGGGRVRVTVEMTRAAAGVRVWGNSYERSADDLMAVETEIARAIAEGVGGQLAPAERRALTAQVTANPEAYDRMLRGNYALSRRTGADMRRAIAEYEAAVRLDVGLARAWARIGLAYYLFIDWGWSWPGLAADSQLARGVLAADRALAVDSTNSDAWMARGLLLSYREPRTHAGAVEALERAVALDARNAEAWHQLAGVLAYHMRFRPAERAFRRSLALDPLRMISLTNLGLLLRYEGRNTDALVALDSAVASNPDAYYPRTMRAWTRLATGDVPGARADLDMAMRLRPADWTIDTEALAAAVLAAQGDSAGAREHAGRLAGVVGDEGALTYQYAWYAATAFVATGQRDRAIATLERSAASGVNLWWALQDPALAPLHGDARYQRLLAAVRPGWASP